MSSDVHFRRVALIGIGLIGSSLARVIRRERLADTVVAYSRSAATRRRAKELDLVDALEDEPGVAVAGAPVAYHADGIRVDGWFIERADPCGA